MRSIKKKNINTFQICNSKKKRRNYTRIFKTLPSHFPPTRLREYSPECASGEKYNPVCDQMSIKKKYISTFQICNPKKKKETHESLKTFP